MEGTHRDMGCEEQAIIVIARSLLPHGGKGGDKNLPDFDVANVNGSCCSHIGDASRRDLFQLDFLCKVS